MEKHDGLTIGRPGWRDVHISHAQQLVLDSNVEEVRRVRVVDVFKSNAKRLQSGRLRVNAADQRYSHQHERAVFETAEAHTGRSSSLICGRILFPSPDRQAPRTRS